MTPKKLSIIIKKKAAGSLRYIVFFSIIVCIFAALITTCRYKHSHDNSKDAFVVKEAQ